MSTESYQEKLTQLELLEVSMNNDTQELRNGSDEHIEINSEITSQEEQDFSEGADEGDLRVNYPQDGVMIEKNDRSLSEFHRWYKQGRLIIEPEWQRSYVWDRRRASKLIESVLVDIPVPVIYGLPHCQDKNEPKIRVNSAIQRTW